jgi:hypothetical protein
MKERTKKMSIRRKINIWTRKETDNYEVGRRETKKISIRLKIDKWTSIEKDTRCMKSKTQADRQINKNKHTLYLYAN